MKYSFVLHSTGRVRVPGMSFANLEPPKRRRQLHGLQ